MSPQKTRVYEFGPFRLAPAKGVLLREGHPVSVAPKAFEALQRSADRPKFSREERKCFLALRSQHPCRP